MKYCKSFIRFSIINLPILFFATSALAEVEAIATRIAPVSTLGKFIDWAIEITVKYSFQVLGGIVILFIGWIAARIFSRFIQQQLLKYKIDITIAKFITNAVFFGVMLLAGLVAMGKFGIEIAPFIAGLSVIGFGTSFALQGPLSNYAAGATLIFTKPFKVGDIIEVVKEMGEVQDITLPRTVLKTVDGTLVVIPNKHIVGEIIHNFSQFKRVDVNIGIAYTADVDKAIQLIRDVVEKDQRITQNPSLRAGISSFGESSVNLYVRLWCRQADFWEVLFSVHKNILAEFKKNEIVIPFPQRDVHIINEKEEQLNFKAGRISSQE